ncbi:toll-like receptor 13 [Ambystoma mexicanum]|uniref:toll-like receptor 13 n=1 Tax=Ambystoma mexicanum TaxID=8296 RepID=UPI0037E95203
MCQPRASPLIFHLGLSFLFFFPGAMSYGFRNCIQIYEHPQNYNCIQRFLKEVRGAVSDLPNDTQCLNISHNLIRQLPWGSFQHLPQLTILRMDFNHLQEIHNGAFETLSKLVILNISHNNIRKLSRGSFHGLRNLTVLLIDNNHLLQVGQDTFQLLNSLALLDLSSNILQNFSQVIKSISTLNKLQTLNLCKNKLKSLSYTIDLPTTLSYLSLCDNSLNIMDCRTDYFAHVHWLDLSDNYIRASTLMRFNLTNITYLLLKNNSDFQVLEFLKTSNIRPQSIDYSGMNLNNGNLSILCRFLGNRTLPELTLLSNGIRSLNNNTFSQCPQVKILNLSRNKLKHLRCLNAVYIKSLETLVVQHNLLSSLESCSSKRPHFGNLQQLTLSFNRILTVGQNAFSFAPNLLNLYLNVNSIASLSKGAFKGLLKLQVLRLDNNLLTDLFTENFAALINLRHLLLRNNRVAVIFPNTFVNLNKLEILDLGGNKISHLTHMSFYGLSNLSKLYLDWNKLTVPILDSQLFTFVQSSLQVLDLTGNYLMYISTRRERSPFENLHKLKDLKIQSQQPYGIKIIPPKFFKGLTSLEDLYLSNNKILTVSPNVFGDLGELRHLDLSDSCNGIQNLPSGIFRNQTKLLYLNLENIGLQSLTSDVFGNLTNLQALHLMKNALKIVDETVVSTLTKLKYLDLRKCPLSCTCKNKWFKSWLNNSHVQIVYPYNQSCDAGPWAYIYSLDMSVCYSRLGKGCFIGTAPVLLIFMILPILYTRCYWQLKYNIYIFRAWLRENWNRKDKDIYKYDAFVSYNSHDESWVLQELLPQLESSEPLAFRLCLHHRDFELGRDIIGNIVDSIYNSRKTICVISRNYLRSEWCSLEIQLASYRLLDERKDVLVLVFLEKIPERELSAYHRMRRVMLSRTYISWPVEPEAQKLFWSKVCRALQSNEQANESIDGLSMTQELLVESARLQR